MALQPISVPSAATMDAGQPRPQHSEPAGASVQTQGDPHVAAPVVVVQFGGQALGLARSPLTPNPNAARAAVDDDFEWSALGPNAMNAALLGPLDANARRARVLTPGAESESAPLYQPPNSTPSGFFRSSGVTGAESPLASDGLDDGLDWFFPGSPSSRALDSASARPDAQFAVELAGLEFPASTTPSQLPAPSPPLSGFFSSVDAAPVRSTPSGPGITLDASERSAEQLRETRTLERSLRQGGADEPVPRAVLAGYVSSVQLQYEADPEARHDFVEANIPVDVTPVPGDPAATLRKMEAIRRAVSSGSPSSSARDAAAEAAQLALRARAQLAAERYTEVREYQAKSPVSPGSAR